MAAVAALVIIFIQAHNVLQEIRREPRIARPLESVHKKFAGLQIGV